MGVTGYVGLMGSGKTRRVVKAGLVARAEGRELFANFRFGDRRRGWMVPLCGDAIHFVGQGEPHDAERYEFRASTPILDYYGKELQWRYGLGFVPWKDANILTSWSQLEALRVHRDEMGAAHKVRVVEIGVDSKGQPVYDSVRACRVYDCRGCSKGITVLIDELNLWAPSRLWAELGLGVLQRWAYARKDGLDIVWSAQHEARVDKVAREVTDFVWSCSAFGGSWGGLRTRFQIFHRVRWIPALLTDKARTNPQEGSQGGGIVDQVRNSETDWVIKFGRRLGTKEEECYDTYEHVAPSRHLGAKASEPQAAAVAGVSTRPGEPIPLRRNPAPPRTYEDVPTRPMAPKRRTQ